MSNFRGKNTIKSVKNLASERVRYDTQAFEDNPPQVVNFNFAEKGLYGRVNRSHSPIVPLRQYIVPLNLQSESPGMISIMDFVADQFYDFENHMSNAFRMGLLPSQDPIFSKIEPRRGYLDPSVLYDNYVDDLVGLYSNTFLQKYKKDINSFNDYLYYLPSFMEIMRDGFPITYSGFQRSSQSNLFTSGLAIDIAGVSFSNDEAKQKLLLESPCFQFYLAAAEQYGFSVNKRNPGVLICDITSPATDKYRRKYNISSLDKLFRTQYTRTLYKDMPELVTLLVNGYNSFISKNRIKRELYTCGEKTKSEVSIRQYISEQDINNILYNNIIKTYIILRNIEERKPFNHARLNTITQQAIQFKTISEPRMLDYIDDQFRKEYNVKDGSLTYYKKKLHKILDKRP